MDDKLKMTVVSRAMLDFEVMASGQELSDYFRSLEVLKGLSSERQRLSKMLNIFYLVTGALAVLVLAGPSANAVKISFLGIEAPANVLPTQAIAVLMAGVFGFYATQFLSFTLLSLMMARTLTFHRLEGGEFVAAPYDAAALWGTLLTPRVVGYRSPRRVWALSLLILFVSSATVLAHALLILGASWWALKLAWQHGGLLPILLGAGSVSIVSVTVIATIAALAWRVPFQMAACEQMT